MSVTALMLALVMGHPTADLPTPPPLPSREFRAVWVATVDNIDWPSKRGIPTAQAQSEMISILDKCRELNLNAVILQVRPTADALYDSKIEPWSEYLTGQQGKAPDPYWDPLKVWVEEAHKRGLELHCWFNPYRALHPAQKGPVAANHISRTNPDVVKQYGKYLWMDPGEPLVQKRSLDVILDVVKRYDVDGVHIDDYFYPYKEKGPDGKLLDFPDEPSYSRLQKRGSTTSRGDWRRANVDGFIERLYDGIKKTKKWVKFGISPFGIYRPGYPDTIKAGVDQFGDLYADALKWYQKGWCDYFTPQLYWPIKQTAQSYPVLLKWWAEQNKAKRHFWPGNFTGRTAPDEGNWPAQEVVDQIDLTRKMPGAEGNVHFSMKCFMGDYNGISTALKNGPYRNAALIPSSPWLGDGKPKKPEIDLSETSTVTTRSSVAPVRVRSLWRVGWAGSRSSDTRFYAVCFGREEGGKVLWSPWKVSADATASMNQDATEPFKYVAVVSISRTGVPSDPVVVAKP